ncbi:protein SPT2 homolog [Panulirus ornatus]|uniref:protein SPT2 homolog n=1 Tax=Panulirus ornatus TaxID=150431 RepID=UPI003A89337F
MDFSYLLELAKSNDKSNKKEAAVSRFSTKVSKPKKVERPSPKLSAIQAVLNKKEEDKLKENEDARRKKENLLALRAQDKKSNKRVKAMINRNKGASKAVLDDAKDITTAKGEEQCDEDDYGYESAMSQHIFSKLANQYANMPEDDKLKFVKSSSKSSIDDIKNRVINTLKKEEEDELGPRKRKRKRKYSASDDFINDGDEYDILPSTSEEKSPPSSSQRTVNINLTNYKSDKYNNFKYDNDKEKEKENSIKEKHKKHKEKNKSKVAPPPMSFEELLRVAKKKQTEPLPEVKEEKKEKEKKKDVGRPLTAKEKEELEDERRRKLKRMGKLPPEKKEVDKPKDKEQKSDSYDSEKIRKDGEKNNKKHENNSKLQQALQKPKAEPKIIDRSKYFAVPGGQKAHDPPQVKESKPMQSFKPPVAKTQNVTSQDYTSKNMKPQKSADFPLKDMKKSKPQKPPSKDKVREFPPPDVRRRPQYNPPPKRRIESDSEEEYDSEMDDFIDDGEEEMDFSSEIRRMFGYDKRKYQDVDDDDCNDMEASYSQMEKEEKISAKIGLKEDLEDMRREEEEKKLKMMRLKQMKKAKR